MGHARGQQPDRRMAAPRGTHLRSVTFEGTCRSNSSAADRVTGFLTWLDVDAAEFNLDGLFDQSSPSTNQRRSRPDALKRAGRSSTDGAAVGVLTNGSKPQQEAELRAIGLHDRFDVVLGFSELPAGKPDPRAFHAFREP